MERNTMLRFERRFTCAALGVERTDIALRRPGFRVYVLTTCGVSVESRARATVPPRRSTERPPAGQLTIVLDGQFAVRRGGREQVITPGEAGLDEVDAWDERWDGAPFRALVVEWDGEHGHRPPGLTIDRLAGADHAAMAGFTDRLVADALGAGEITALVDRLRALGVPLEATPAWTPARPPEPAIRLAAALGHALTRLDRSPDILDVSAHAGTVERVVRRRWPTLQAWVTLPATWRALLAETRLGHAVALATTPGATVERIAAAVGYRGPSALLAALRARGLDSPARIRQRHGTATTAGRR